MIVPFCLLLLWCLYQFTCFGDGDCVSSFVVMVVLIDFCFCCGGDVNCYCYGGDGTCVSLLVIVVQVLPVHWVFFYGDYAILLVIVVVLVPVFVLLL